MTRLNQEYRHVGWSHWIIRGPRWALLDLRLPNSQLNAQHVNWRELKKKIDNHLDHRQDWSYCTFVEPVEHLGVGTPSLPNSELWLTSWSPHQPRFYTTLVLRYHHMMYDYIIIAFSLPCYCSQHRPRLLPYIRKRTRYFPRNCTPPLVYTRNDAGLAQARQERRRYWCRAAGTPIYT